MMTTSVKGPAIGLPHVQPAITEQASPYGKPEMF
jgi:hypothetical protein